MQHKCAYASGEEWVFIFLDPRFSVPYGKIHRTQTYTGLQDNEKVFPETRKALKRPG